MKKILSSALALIMLLSCLSVTAFAAENPTTTDKGATITATGSYVPNVVSQVVSLDVAWGAMTFTFSSNTNWDPSTHTSSGTSGWTAEGNDITLTNHSNADIVAKLNFYSEINGLGGNFYDAAENGNAITDVTLATADGTSVAEAPAKTIYFRMEQGEITQDEANLGTVYLTISDSQTSTHEWVNGTCTICKKTMVTTEVSGSTLILTIPANVYHPSIATAMEEVSRNDQITAFVVKGSVTSAQYDIVKNGRNGAAVFFTDLQTNNYISAAGNTYTCTLGSASDEKYVLIARRFSN